MLCVLSGQRCRQVPQCQGHVTVHVPAEPLTKSAVASWTPGSPATPAEAGYGRGPAVEHVALRGPRRGGAPLQTTAAAQFLEASLALEGVEGAVWDGSQAALHVRGQQVLGQVRLWRAAWLRSAEGCRLAARIICLSGGQQALEHARLWNPARLCMVHRVMPCS